MSGKHITDQQVRLYMEQRNKHSQSVSAAKTGMSERSARRIDNGQLQPNKKQRKYRTREDPLAPLWDDVIVPMLKSSPDIQPVGIFDHLCEHHSDSFKTSHRRTLERRIRSWCHLHRDSQEVVFIQRHELGDMGICDFTHADFTVTIAGESLTHKLFHYRLVASGWAYAQVTYGGESFAAFSDGLQNALRASGGVPKTVRTDSLSAAYKNRDETDDFTERYQELITHYGFTATRNNTGVAQENGAIESPNRHLKSQLKQALIIRGHADFDNRGQYEQFVHEIVARRNRRIKDKFVSEQRQLAPLPESMSANYSDNYVRVSRTSTIQVKRVTYSVPSRLINSRLKVQLYDDRLELFLGQEYTCTLLRIYANKSTRKHSINYEHVIESLVKKPRAFRCSQWRDDLLPNEDYRQIWSHVDKTLSADKACHYIVRLLHLAKKSGHQDALGRFVLARIQGDHLPSILDSEERYLPQKTAIPNVTVVQHELSSYCRLLSGGAHE